MSDYPCIASLSVHEWAWNGKEYVCLTGERGFGGYTVEIMTASGSTRFVVNTYQVIRICPAQQARLRMEWGM